MKNKKITVILIVVILIAFVGTVVWKWDGNKKTSSMPQEQVKQQGQLEHQDFVVDVDSDVSHWQTKKAEVFTVKFPKEWYWLESSHGEGEGYSRVITNNPNLDMVKNAEIGIFSDIGPDSPITLSDDTEIVITDRGSATSDAGTPQDSLNTIFKWAKENNPSAVCNVLNNKTIPFTAYCSVVFNDSKMRQQSYYIINKELTLTFTAWTTQKNDKNLIDILGKIAKSYSY